LAADNEIIEQCAAIADRAVVELQATLRKSRKSQYDRQGPLQVKYAIRWCERIGERIRAQKPVEREEGIEVAVVPSAPEAIMLLKELRPLIERSRDSKWRVVILARIDALIKTRVTSA
jgi:hypothetical protein